MTDIIKEAMDLVILEVKERTASRRMLHLENDGLEVPEISGGDSFISTPEVKEEEANDDDEFGYDSMYESDVPGNYVSEGNAEW
ncbi:hypothetical protein HIM_10639 [Hirsutella minnesotensis 3608]|uniref:Uncharacterized protein n=1 Tax=Hirsutella minnesotensis 3608 TaxID=1043627 RepID=A0A0F7ZRP4_9HYPO|nr:hypothetical protein HIM_10639 [Hirsutella minnesotensis 3608]